MLVREPHQNGLHASRLRGILLCKLAASLLLSGKSPKMLARQERRTWPPLPSLLEGPHKGKVRTASTI